MLAAWRPSLTVSVPPLRCVRVKFVGRGRAQVTSRSKFHRWNRDHRMFLGGIGDPPRHGLGPIRTALPSELRRHHSGIEALLMWHGRSPRSLAFARRVRRCRERTIRRGTGGLPAGAVARLNHFGQADGELCTFADVAGVACSRRRRCNSSSKMSRLSVKSFWRNSTSRRARSRSASVAGETASESSWTGTRERTTSRTVTRGPIRAVAICSC
jgi:hypothetical protein